MNRFKPLLTALAMCLISITCRGTIVGPYPGLERLIEKSDAIVVLRTGGPVVGAPLDTSQFSTYHCMIYQSLKGQIPINKRTQLQLMDTHSASRSSTHFPFSTGSTYLVFLTKKRAPDEPTEYHTIENFGSHIRLSPFGHEKMPVGNNIMEQVRSLVTSAKIYWAEQAKREFEFYDMLLTDELPKPAPRATVTSRRESSSLGTTDSGALPVVHEVKPGETISSLALRYYGPDLRLEGAAAIKKANPQILRWETRPMSAEPKRIDIPALPAPPK